MLFSEARPGELPRRAERRRGQSGSWSDIRRLAHAGAFPGSLEPAFPEGNAAKKNNAAFQ